MNDEERSEALGRAVAALFGYRDLGELPADLRSWLAAYTMQMIWWSLITLRASARCYAMMLADEIRREAW